MAAASEPIARAKSAASGWNVTMVAVNRADVMAAV
jgi:hypothetical protein